MRLPWMQPLEISYLATFEDSYAWIALKVGTMNFLSMHAVTLYLLKLQEVKHYIVLQTMTKQTVNKSLNINVSLHQTMDVLHVVKML